MGLERVSSLLDVLAGLSQVGPERVSSLLDVLAGVNQVGLRRVSSAYENKTTVAALCSEQGLFIFERSGHAWVPNFGLAKPSKSRSLT